MVKSMDDYKIELRAEQAGKTGEYPGGSDQARRDVLALLEAKEEAVERGDYESRFSARWVNANITWGILLYAVFRGCGKRRRMGGVCGVKPLWTA